MEKLFFKLCHKESKKFVHLKMMKMNNFIKGFGDFLFVSCVNTKVVCLNWGSKIVKKLCYKESKKI